MAWEAQPVLRATLDDLDMTLVESYLEWRSHRSKVAGRFSNLEKVLLNIGCATTTEGDRKQKVIRPTNAGMLLFLATILNSSCSRQKSVSQRRMGMRNA